ncbi:MAG: selenocysteine-specific translation elongation factor [Actinomycetota bacterium]|nr:selenocysteine-specific translation elongation factor [Actinomycetota bacterium]
MPVVATAGHVDHGKSTLVRALTGMEPDRWAEERRRGMTIDLGYAWTTLPSGAQLAFVDVPGHQRFIANMLAGLGPAPAVLFVVAADEGWSRQSAEHLAAIDALEVRHGLLAVTRSDLADPAPARREALGRLARSSLGELDSVTVSGITAQGIDELRTALDRLLASLPAADRAARVRLWVDRSFTARGSGTVVTGTLSAGAVAVGDELELRGRRVTVRGVQSLGEQRERVEAVGRVALNLRAVDRDEIGRGDVLVTPGAWHWTRTVDVRLASAEQLPAELVLHVGTASESVHLRPLGGGGGLVRLATRRPLPIQAGDRAVLRDPGRQSVAAGVLVLDADPPPFTRRGAAGRRADELATALGRPDPRVEIERRGSVRRDRMAALGIALDDLADVRSVGEWLVGEPTWRGWVRAAPAAVAEWAARSPLEPAMPLTALVRALGLPAHDVLAPLLADAQLHIRNGRVGPTEPASSLGTAEDGVRSIEAQLRDAPFAAPESTDLADLGLGRRELAAAERAGRLVRISADIVLLPSAPAVALEALRALPQPFTTSQARQALGTTRRVAVPLLEYLDEHDRTERVDGSTRRVRKAAETHVS